MAEKNENEVLNGAATSQEEKTPDENLTAPGEQLGQTETPQTEQPQAETPGLDADTPSESSAPGIADTPPEVADGDVAAPSNIKDGLFEDKLVVSKQGREQEKARQDAPTAGGMPRKRGAAANRPKRISPKNSRKRKNRISPISRSGAANRRKPRKMISRQALAAVLAAQAVRLGRPPQKMKPHPFPPRRLFPNRRETRTA